MKLSKLNSLRKNKYKQYLTLLAKYDFRYDGKYIGIYNKKDIPKKIIDILNVLDLVKTEQINGTDYLFLNKNGFKKFRDYENRNQ